MNSYSLLILLLVPLAGALVCALLPSGRHARRWSLGVSLVTAALGLSLAFGFDFGASGMQYRYDGFTAPDVGLGLRLGLDAIGLWLVVLTVCLTPLAVAASFGSIRERQKEYYAWMLALLAAMLGVFVARDVLLFYVFFELTLVPMFFIIGIWGGPDRRRAAGRFFLFTFAGSVFTLAAAVYLGLKAGSFDIPEVTRYAQHSLSATARFWVLLGFLAGFAVKVPLFPVHTWLPLAHTEAPTAGSVILAGVLLKLGTYGLLRLAVPMGLVGSNFNEVLYTFHLVPGVAGTLVTVTAGGVVRFLGVLCVIGVIYGALIAWVQQDIKKLVAYSSVSHLGFCVLGLVALNDIGLQGSVLYMINHGISTGALFLVIGMIYDRYHTRDINQLSGLARQMPRMAFFFLLFTFSSIGLPLTNGFVSEFLTILGAFVSPLLGWRFGAVAATGIVLGALYMLHMAAHIIWGPFKVPGLHGAGDGGHGARAAAGHGDPHHDPERLKRGANADLAADAPGTQPDAMRRHDAPTAADTPQADQGQAATPARSHAAGHSAHGHGAPGDLNGREIAILLPLAVAVLVLGVAPAPLLRSILRPIQEIRTPVATRNDARPRPQGTGTNEVYGVDAVPPVAPLPDTPAASAPAGVSPAVAGPSTGL